LVQLLSRRKDGNGACGFNALFGGDLALGAGLSSSAALEVSSALAIALRYGLGELIPSNVEGSSNSSSSPSHELAKVCLYSEHNYVGVKCGLLDQFSSLYAKSECLVLSDFRTLEVDSVPLGADASFLICNTHVHHNLVQSEYNARRESCEAATKYFAEVLAPKKVTHLRDVTWDEWNNHSQHMKDTVAAKRAAHIIGEDERVLKGKQLLSSHSKESLADFGKSMYESHNSSRVYFENSCKELDEVIQHAQQIKEVLGARLSGGGFGGSTVLLVKKSDIEKVKKDLQQALKGTNYEVFAVLPKAGAKIIKK